MPFGLKKRGPPQSPGGPPRRSTQAPQESAEPGPERSNTERGTNTPGRPASSSKAGFGRPLAALATRIRAFVRAIEANDETRIEEELLRLSRSRRAFAPLAFAVGAFALLFNGLKLLVFNWRLALVQVLPAMWIWLAMADLKLHVLHGDSFHVLRGPVLVPIILVIAAITVASFFLNAVFAFAIARPGAPEVRPAVAQARRHLTPILVSGSVVGVLLGLSTTVVTRWGRPWFSLSLGIVIGVMMVCYVAVPSRLIGVKPTHSRRDKLWTTVVAGVLGATVSAPPYLLGRVGILMLGSSALRIPGIFVLALGVTLEAGATGAVRAIKMSATLAATRHPTDTPRNP
jgi:hypothetical protein